jgi:hypothetical protein
MRPSFGSATARAAHHRRTAYGGAWYLPKAQWAPRAQLAEESGGAITALVEDPTPRVERLLFCQPQHRGSRSTRDSPQTMQRCTAETLRDYLAANSPGTRAPRARGATARAKSVRSARRPSFICGVSCVKRDTFETASELATWLRYVCPRRPSVRHTQTGYSLRHRPSAPLPPRSALHRPCHRPSSFAVCHRLRLSPWHLLWICSTVAFVDTADWGIGAAKGAADLLLEVEQGDCTVQLVALGSEAEAGSGCATAGGSVPGDSSGGSAAGGSMATCEKEGRRTPTLGAPREGTEQRLRPQCLRVVRVVTVVVRRQSGDSEKFLVHVRSGMGDGRVRTRNQMPAAKARASTATQCSFPPRSVAPSLATAPWHLTNHPPPSPREPTMHCPPPPDTPTPTAHRSGA